MKQFFIYFTAMLFCCLSTKAQNAGDYVYTDDGKFKIISGENLVSNGDFSLGLKDWTTDGGKELNADTFYVENDGPDGSLCLKVNMKDNGPGTGSSLLRKIPVQAGVSYYITYSAKANEDVITTVTTGAGVKNYQNIYFNYDGSLTPIQPIASVKNYSLDWTKIEYSYTASANGYIVFHFYGPYIGTSFDDFKVLMVKEVINDRESQVILNKLQEYLDNPLFPNGHDILEGYMDMLRQYIEDDDIAGYKDLVAIMDIAIDEFLDANTVDVSNFVKSADFEETDVTIGKSITTIGGADGWHAWGSDNRWTQRNPTEPFTSIYVKREINGSYVLREGGLYQELNDMPAGQYMFRMKVRAAKYKDKQNNVDKNYEIRGLKIFVNNDSVEMYPIQTEELTIYTVYSKIDVPGKLTIGIYIPDSVCNLVDLDNANLRIIGVTQDYINDYFTKRELAEAKKGLKITIDDATELTKSDFYLYEKDELTEDIAVAQNVYDTATEALVVTDATKALNDSVNTFKKHNNLYTSLINTIMKAEELLSAPGNTQGRDALDKTIADAKAFVASLSTEPSVETDRALVAWKDALDQAMTEFNMANITADEKYLFLNWAQQDGATYTSSLDMSEQATTTTGYAAYKETAIFGGHDLNGRIAFNDQVQPSLNYSHGLSVFFPSKNKTVMSILDLKEGDQVTLDYSMGNNSHSVYVQSANAWTVKDGKRTDFIVGDKKPENLLDKTDDSGMGGKTRVVFNMTADGSLDFYFGSSSSTMRISYIGITYAENIIDGIEKMETSSVNNAKVYTLSGQFVGTSLKGLKKGIYIRNGHKYVVK